MSQMSHAEVTLLALLSDAPAHAYDLIRRIHSMQVERWARVPSSTVYAVLRRMERRGWVAGMVEPGARRRHKTTYRITEAGRQRLDRLIAQGLRNPTPVYSDLLVAGVLAAATGRGVVLAEALAQVRAARDRLKEVDLDATGPLSPEGRIVVDFYRGLADLTERALSSLAQLAESHDPTPPSS
ncbi:MAG: PadR family transcriptional regulator [Gemmatimonadetes bacterium]|nr:MAG: PadR family transcriptional regulator [Gemmatimonadota bacterium]